MTQLHVYAVSTKMFPGRDDTAGLEEQGMDDGGKTRNVIMLIYLKKSGFLLLKIISPGDMFVSTNKNPSKSFLMNTGIT